jgi:hypothetical protein
MYISSSVILVSDEGEDDESQDSGEEGDEAEPPPKKQRSEAALSFGRAPDTGLQLITPQNVYYATESAEATTVLGVDTSMIVRHERRGQHGGSLYLCAVEVLLESSLLMNSRVTKFHPC